MAKILIAEDDEFLRDILNDYLTNKGYKITAVPNGKAAREIALTGGFNLIVSDVQMPLMNGVELLRSLREQSKIPFILMTGFTNLLETQKASDLGADGFLSKPFSNHELLRLVKDLLNPSLTDTEGGQSPQEVDAAYCKVPIDEFVARPKIDYDIFIKLHTGKYLKVAHDGETLDIARLRNYKAKGIMYLHIRKDDFNKLVNFNLEVSKILQNNTAVSKEKKLRFMRYTAETIMERCYRDEVDPESFNEAKDFFTGSMETFLAEPQLMQLAEVLNEHADHLYAHSLGVAIYSVMIAKAMNLTSTQTCFKLSMAGFFHDIGKKEIDRALLEKPRPLLSVAERKLIESHVQRSREIMESIHGIPSEVLQIIYEHHEDELETGYPATPSRFKLHPLSRIVHVANLFVNKAIHSPANPGGSPSSAISHIEKFDLERVNKIAFNALKTLIKERKAA